jgi:PQQ-dependent dehydrogenase (methanol/ethanol family)
MKKQLSIFLGLLFFSKSVFSHNQIFELMQNPANWVMWGGDYAATRFSQLSQINTQNVKNLKPVWTFSTGVLRGHEGGALFVNGILYLHTPFPNTVYAINPRTQSIIWEYTPQQNVEATISVMCCDTVNHGLAYGDGKLFLQQADTVLTALDAQTGKHLWSTQNGDPKLGMTNTNAPIVAGNKVLTGISGGEYGVRGFLAAYDINDGHLIWKGYSMGPDQDTLINPLHSTTWKEGKVQLLEKNSGTSTWQGEQWKIGGGTTWGWYSYDPKLNLIYYGTGNPSTWNSTQRPGDNKWAMSLWARNADTGEVKWVYQITPHDEWDYDSINESVLIDQDIKGNLRKTLVHFDRNGFAYVLDRETGELLSAEKFDHSINWAKRIDLFTGRPIVDEHYSPEQHGEDTNTTNICPAVVGSKNQQPVSYSPNTELFYISGNHLCMDLEPFAVNYITGQPYIGAVTVMKPAGADVITGLPDNSHNLGQFTAFNAKTGKIVWSNKENFSVWSGSLATAGDVVFYGTMEGYLKAIDAHTGNELYKFKTPSGIVGNVTTWEDQGKQYIGVFSGIGGEARSNMGFDELGSLRSLDSFTKLGGVFTVFSLPD